MDPRESAALRFKHRTLRNKERDALRVLAEVAQWNIGLARVEACGLGIALVSALDSPADVVGHPESGARLGRTGILPRGLEQLGELLNDQFVRAFEGRLNGWWNRFAWIATDKAPTKHG